LIILNTGFREAILSFEINLNFKNMNNFELGKQCQKAEKRYSLQIVWKKVNFTNLLKNSRS